MSRPFHIEVDAVKMFHGHTWLDLGDRCDHACPHRGTAVIAWGPTTVTYELVECTDCRCRSWQDGRQYQFRERERGNARWWREHADWRKPDPPMETSTTPPPQPPTP